jgi:hypothetical protein
MMNPRGEEQPVPLNDFVDYIEDLSIPRLPETKMGRKLKNNLKKDADYDDLYSMKNYMALSDEKRNIVEAVEVVFKEATSIDSVFTILDNILNYPYEDSHRIIRLEQYPDDKVLHMGVTFKLLELIGFENGSTSTIFILPYDRDLSKVLLALETLIRKISHKIEVSHLI